MFPVFGAGENTVIGSNIGGTATRILFVDANGALAQSSKLTLPAPDVAGQGPSITAGTATTDVNALSITQTWNEGSTAFTAIKANVTNTASAATALLMDLQVGAASKFKVSKAGLVTTADYFEASAATGFYWTGRTTLLSPADGVLELTNNGGNDFSRLQFGGTTSSFPALKRSSAELQVRLADDSAYANVDALGLKRGGVVTISGTAPTLASGGCTSPTAVTANGTAAFSVGVGTSCSGSQPLVFTLPAATTGWQCTARNTTNAATSVAAQSSGVSTTSVTITSYSRTTGLAQAWTDSDVVAVSCMAY